MKNNIPIYRAKKIDSDEYVEGFYVDTVEFFTKTLRNENGYITKDGNFHIIDISTLSIHFPDMLDSNQKPMFASLQEDGKGGDLVRMGKNCASRTLVYKYGQFWFTDFSNNQLNSNPFQEVAFNLDFREEFNKVNKLRDYINNIEVIGIQE